MSPQEHKTAIVTGGCSGIGLGLVKHLLSKTDVKWRVVVADIRPEAWEAVKSDLDPERTKYIKADVASWDDNAALFKAAYGWKSSGFHGERIDFAALNAGIGDREPVLQPADLDAEPEKPNTLCIDVNFISVLYGVKLFVHYTRKTKRAAAAHPRQLERFNPKLVVSASCVGQYKFPVAPQYAASKHACVGYVRAVGDMLMRHDNIAVNAIMPGYVATNLAPPNLTAAWPKEYVTPIPTMMRAYDELIDEEGAVAQDGKSDGAHGVVKAAETVECSLDRLYYRKPIEPPDESQAFLVDEAGEDGLWFRKVAEAMAAMPKTSQQGGQ